VGLHVRLPPFQLRPPGPESKAALGDSRGTGPAAPPHTLSQPLRMVGTPGDIHLYLPMRGHWPPTRPAGSGRGTRVPGQTPSTHHGVAEGLYARAGPKAFFLPGTCRHDGRRPGVTCRTSAHPRPGGRRGALFRPNSAGTTLTWVRDSYLGPRCSPRPWPRIRRRGPDLADGRALEPPRPCSKRGGADPQATGWDGRAGRRPFPPPHLARRGSSEEGRPTRPPHPGRSGRRIAGVNSTGWPRARRGPGSPPPPT